MLGQKVFQKTTEVKEGKIKNKKICRIVQIQKKNYTKFKSIQHFFYFFIWPNQKRSYFCKNLYLAAYPLNFDLDIIKLQY